jgi:hypothetical protein
MIRSEPAGAPPGGSNPLGGYVVAATTSGGGGGASSSSSFKRADKRASITILVLGDGTYTRVALTSCRFLISSRCLTHSFAIKSTVINCENNTEGVGKSSLISTFVSRYFSEAVPGIMTRVRLPPDPETNCVTTIVDSQNGDTALLNVISQSQQHRLVPRSSANDPAAPSPLQTLMEQAGAAAPLSPGGGRGTAVSSATTGGGVVASPTGAMRKVAAPATPASPRKAATATTSALGEAYPTASVVLRSPSSTVESVDSIILVYDLDRVETFYRLENHWLPLLERCYAGKVRHEVELDNRCPFCSTYVS